MDEIKGKDRLSVKEKMLKVFDSLYENSEEDIAQLDAKDRMKLMTDLAKTLMPKSDVDAADEKNNKKSNEAAMNVYFGKKAI